ncbi:MAG: choice-of-anchor Q domain-containing protein [Thermoanaerobaculia bacterium]
MNRRFCVALCLWSAWSVAPARAVDFHVNSLGDDSDAAIDGICATAAGVCTLRAAVEEAELQNAEDEIFLPPGIIMIVRGNLPDLQAAAGRLTITGAGFKESVLHGSSSQIYELIWVKASGWLKIRDLTLENFQGFVTGGGGVITDGGTLVVERCSFSGNQSNYGGSIQQLSGGDVTVSQTAFANGMASQQGGEIYVSSGLFRCHECIFEGAHADLDGGAIYFASGSSGRIENSLFAGNTADRDGGAIYSEVQNGGVELVNSTVTANSAAQNGGGIASPSHQLDIYSTTITDNHADSDLDGTGDGGGVFYFVNAGSLIANSILSGNLASVTINGGGLTLAWPSDCSGPVASNGFNFIRNILTGCDASDHGCCTITGGYGTANPLLQPAIYNGGSTRTQAIGPGSPALENGAPGGCADGMGGELLTDQRGAPRVANGRCDLGAFEYGSLIFNDDFDLWEWKWSTVVP